MNQQNNQNHISLLLLTHNNDKELSKNFKWLNQCPAIDEIIVIDDNSTDNTIKTIKSFAFKNIRQVKYWSRGLANNFAAQRQYGLQHTTNDWVLWLDPDEQPNKKTIDFINQFDVHQYNYSFRRLEYFLHHPLRHGETTSLRFIRLFNKRFGKFSGRVHEFWDSSKPITHTSYSIEHHSNTTLVNFYEKINLYSSIRAQELFDNKVKTNLFQIIFFPVGKFLLNYILRLGFLDSTPGIIFALGMSFHSFLVRAKLWHLWQE